MASPSEQRIEDDDQNEPVSAVETNETIAVTQELASQSSAVVGAETSIDTKDSEDPIQIQDTSMDIDDEDMLEKPMFIKGHGANNETSVEAFEENDGTSDDKVASSNKESGADKEGLDEPSFMSLVKGSENDHNKTVESEEAELLGLNEAQKQENENIDEESEKALLTEGTRIDDTGLKMVEEENMDTSESFASEKLQPPQHFGDKEVSETNSRNDADSEVEMEMKRADTLHVRESVYNIDEETRMGLDQTPSESSMASTLVTPLPPKKLFHSEDTKDSVDSETKLSTNTDTEDIRLRNTLSVDQENTKDSMASDSCPTPAKRMRGYREGLGDVIGETKHFTAENLFEYQWPQDGGEWHMLQEQISEFLKVKSFKRKYPDLYRRVCDKEEKDFLREKGVVSETQSDLGLTALRSEEVYDLMMKDYNDRYQEYLTVLQEKQKRVMREKHKEYGVAKLDKSKMEAYSKKAARWAAEFNASLMREKREERQAYFDLQTYTIHHCKNRFRSLPPKSTKTGSYPIALITGQYQDNFKRYQPEELRNFPLKTALTDPPPRVKYVLKPPASVMKPVDAPVVEIPDVEAKTVDDTENREEEKDKENIDSKDVEASEVSSLAVEPDQAPDATFKFDKRGKLVNVKKLTKGGKLSATPEKGRKSMGGRKKEDTTDDDGGADGAMPKQIHALEKCRICKQRSSKEDRLKDKLIRCAQCKKIGHMSCLDLTDELVAVIKMYPWQCMECKTCVQCMDPYDEDKMMFCDRCDRGYHTFCIGLEALPTGHWECRSCVDRKPDGDPGDTREEINSHNVIKDENQDSQDSIKDAGKPAVAPGKWSRQILEPKPLSENELTTEYLMRLAGRNTNWRKDTGNADPESIVSPPPTNVVVPPVTPAPSDTPLPPGSTPATSNSTPGVKKEKSAVKRKRSEMNMNPTRSRPDRVQGARQSKRIKAREEEEEEDNKNEDDEEPKKNKDEVVVEKKQRGRKKKVVVITEAGDGDTAVKDEKEEGVDGACDDVIEGVDDSGAVMFDKNEDVEETKKEDAEEEMKEEEDEDSSEDKEEDADDSEDKESEDDQEEKEFITKEDKELECEEKSEEAEETEVPEEVAVKEVDEDETASAADKLLEIIDGPGVEMEQEQEHVQAANTDVIEGDLQSGDVMRDEHMEGVVDSTGVNLDSQQAVKSLDEENETTAKADADQGAESVKESSNISTEIKEVEQDVGLSQSHRQTNAIESQQISAVSITEESSSQLSSSKSPVHKQAADTTETNTHVDIETQSSSNNKPASPSSSSSLSSASSISSASSSLPMQTAITSATIEPETPKEDTNNSVSLPATIEIPLPSSNSNSTSPPLPVSSIPLPTPIPPPTSTTQVSDIPLPSSPTPPSTTSAPSPPSKPNTDIDPACIPLPMDTD